MPSDPSLEKKRRAAEAAIRYIDIDEVLGIGTGSTVNQLIDVLKERRLRPKGAVSSSRQTSENLSAARIPELDLNTTGDLYLYIDGADQATADGVLIKGGGAALTREKVIAAAAKRFVCIIDSSKLAPSLGGFPLPVEVIAMARSYVARRLVTLGGQPVWREGVMTDNGNPILDVHNLELSEPEALEAQINQIAGVVTVGLFARRRADVLIVAGDEGVRVLDLESQISSRVPISTTRLGGKP